MSERIEKFKFRRELRKIDWNSVIKVTMQTHKKKSEADKVLADKDAEIARLNAIRKVHVEAIESMKAGLLQDYKAICHNKYKRGLSMADYCYMNVHCIIGHRLCAFSNRKKEWFERWYKRWLAIAEKFKEAK